MQASKKNLVFIHGLFQNSKSWEQWIPYFEALGYTCHAPNYPCHEGEPAELRRNIPKGLGKVSLNQVVKVYSDFIDTLDEKPVLIGHSMGGLVVQKLIAEGKGRSGICLSSAPAQGIFPLTWSFIKANLPTLNPFAGSSPALPSVKGYQYAFCNTQSLEEVTQEYEQYVVPESRKIAWTSLLGQGKVPFRKAHAPLLIITGSKDNIIPPTIGKQTHKAYKDKNSRCDYKMFEGRTHNICHQEDWEEVAGYIQNWLSAL